MGFDTHMISKAVPIPPSTSQNAHRSINRTPRHMPTLYLQSYVSAAESIWSTTDPWMFEARIMAGRLLRSVDELSSCEPP